MRLAIPLTTALTLLAASTSCAEDLVDAHIEAVGGNEAIAKIKSVRRTGKITGSSGYGPLSGTIEEIRERNFNLDIKNPNAPEDTHEDPDTLLARYGEEKAAASEIREQLRKVLSDALEGRA